MTTDARVALVRNAIFTVLDEREWDFTNDEHRVDFADRVGSFVPSESAPTVPKPDPVADLCVHIKESIRLCGHGYIHITCGDCQRRD